MDPNVKNILSKINLDNIWSNSYDDIVALQKALKVKDDGMIGKNTISALQRELKIKDDGKWGNESIRTAKNVVSQIPEMSKEIPTNQQTNADFNLYDGTWDFGKTITNVKLNRNVPDDYMSETRTGKATPETIAQERLDTVSNYITNDVGSNVSYNLGTHIPRSERNSTIKSTSELKKEFDKAYVQSTGDKSNEIHRPIYPKGWSVTGDYIDANSNVEISDWYNDTKKDASDLTLNFPTVSNYEKELARHVQTTPAETKVTSYSRTPGTETQSQLSDIDRRQWTQELNTEVLQMAELYSQLENAKTKMQNGFTSEQRQAAQEEYNALAHRIAMSGNADTFMLNGKRTNAFPTEYQQAIDAGLNEWNNETKEGLQEMYSKYGMSPYWNHMPWGERYTLDHLYGAGYGYNGPGEKQTVGQIGQKITDAINGSFTPRTYNGADNGSFVLAGDRQGVHRHLTQRGDNLTNWTFNTAPRDASGVKMNTPYFKIGDQRAWDWSEGEPKISLATTNNFKYGIHQRNDTVMADQNIVNNPYMDKDFSTFDSWSPDEQRNAAEWLYNAGFNIGDTSLSGYLSTINTGNQKYDLNSVKKLYTDIQNAAKSLKNPSQKQLSGDNSFYHFPMQQTNKYTSNIFGNSISGVQMMDGKPYTFNQDNYDISIPGFSMFGNETWYRNLNEIPEEKWREMTTE